MRPPDEIPTTQPEYNRHMAQRCACCGVVRWDLDPSHKFVAVLLHRADCPYRDDPGMPARYCCKV